MAKFFLFFAKEFRKKLFRVNAGNLQDAYERFLQLIFYYQKVWFVSQNKSEHYRVATTGEWLCVSLNEAPKIIVQIIRVLQLFLRKLLSGPFFSLPIICKSSSLQCWSTKHEWNVVVTLVKKEKNYAFIL